MPSGARPATVPGMTTTTPISSTAATLRAAGFVGRIVEPQHPDYDPARASWNGAVDRRPAAVAYAGDADDVAAVTCFEFDAHRVGPMVLAGMLVYPWHRAREAMQAARALMDRAPDQLTTFMALITAPPQPPFPPELSGRRVAVGGG